MRTNQMDMKKTHYIFIISFIFLFTLYLSHILFGPDTQDDKSIGNIANTNIIGTDAAVKNSNKSIVSDENILSNENFSFDEKLKTERALNAIAAKNLTIMSGENILKALINRGITILPDMAERMKNDDMTQEDLQTIEIYFAETLSEEENFNIELTQYLNFKELKNAFDTRSKTTGLFYGNDLLKEPRAYRGATLKDIRGLLESGASLPDDVLKHLINAGNIQLAFDLKEAGYDLNIDYVDAFTSMNAIEIQVENIVINPYAGSVDDQTKTIKKLMNLGVPLSFKNGTRDALDIALYGAYNHEPDEAGKLLNLAVELNRSGLNLEKSHIELLEMIRAKHPSLYSQYSDSFR